MKIDLSGQWNIMLDAESGVQQGTIMLPGILQGQGYGNKIGHNTPWVSGLHDTFWFEQEEYKVAQEDECNVPFLAQPPLHFIGKAYYEREFEIQEECTEEWKLRIEITRWRSTVWIDGKYKGEDCSLCTAHEIPCGSLEKGKHVLKVCIDNSMQYPYRPDGHGVSDALGATWNGMAGEILLETISETEQRIAFRRQYAKLHPRKVEIKDGKFYIDEKFEYFRATHFGGDYPLTGYPESNKEWWQKMMRTIKAWGLNGIRCHSYCPPEIAFQTADEEGLYLLVECGMWNHFEEGEEGKEMLSVLRQESRRILQEFGHHPSFVFFSSTNEPGGNWYQPLRQWVQETKEYDEELGYAGRRAYTAQSGWFYDVEPSKIEGTDFIYFHRSGYGPFLGGKIRNSEGWWGGDYRSSLEGAAKPVICHELGQWCVYPDFTVIDKFTGYMKPGNFKVYKERARKQGLLPYASDMAACSGRNQLRLYKEELEANYRTPQLYGFELLDLHDYLGQGTALIGLLDCFWESKGHISEKEFRAFCGETVLLLRCPSYVWNNRQRAELPVEICHFGKENIMDARIEWKLTVCENVNGANEKDENENAGSETVIEQGVFVQDVIPCGENTELGTIYLDFSKVTQSTRLMLTLSMGAIQNQWELYVFAKENEKEELNVQNVQNKSEIPSEGILYTREWKEAKQQLEQGGTVVYAPWLSELNYECPALSVKNVYWNSQMGPTWGRNLGLVVEEEHPIFKEFPTLRSGGWQWEDILENARGFSLQGMDSVKPIVRAIDDWNRSLPLAVLLEGKVGNGKLLLVSANLEGTFEERPAAYTLKKAIMNYVASDSFKPTTAITVQQLEENLFPVLRMEQMIAKCRYEAEAEVSDPEALCEANPHTSVRIEKDRFPVSFELVLKKAVEGEGFLYLPEQRDRGHEGFLKDYKVEYFDEEQKLWCLATEGVLQNTCQSQKIIFPDKITAQKWRFTVYSCYGCVEKKVWKEEKDGWHQVWQPKKAVLQIAGLHILCNEKIASSDRIFWEKSQRSATKEIEN